MNLDRLILRVAKKSHPLYQFIESHVELKNLLKKGASELLDYELIDGTTLEDLLIDASKKRDYEERYDLVYELFAWLKETIDFLDKAKQIAKKEDNKNIVEMIDELIENMKFEAGKRPEIWINKGEKDE